MKYKVIVNGKTHTAPLDFDQVVETVERAYSGGFHNVRVRARTIGQQERPLTADEVNDLAEAVAAKVLRHKETADA